MADQAQEYWSEFETETGEKVEARSIGEYYTGAASPPSLWGIVILTDKSFRFKYIPNENKFLGLFVRQDKPKSDKPVDIVIPRGEVASVSIPKRNFLSLLFSPPFPRFALTKRASSEAGAEESFLFSVDPSSGIIPALKKAFPSSAS
jgi:hypothetical protein